MIETRIYVVMSKTDTGGEDRRLIEAGSAAQAIRFVVRHRYAAKAASPKDLAALMTNGIRIEKVSDDNTEAEQTKRTY